MLLFFLNRLKQSIILMFLMSLLAFGAMYVAGDPVAILANDDYTEQDIQELTIELGLDQPIYVQYGRFIRNTLYGDFGTSFVYNLPVLDLITERLPATIEIAVLALLIALSIGIPLGIYSGLNRKKSSNKSNQLFNNYWLFNAKFLAGFIVNYDIRCLVTNTAYIRKKVCSRMARY